MTSLPTNAPIVNIKGAKVVWADIDPITGSIKPEDIDIPSPYNTYRNKGLPPHPIDNPGIDAIKAVLYPEETECMFYLHDESKTIHCAKTFEEHKINIATYLSD